jgi:hypothetical protein
MADRSEDEKRQWNIVGIAIPAGVLIGLGVGFYTDNIAGGIFIGLGGGFLAMFFGMLILRSRR